MITYSQACLVDAKKQGLHLVKLEINGRYAKRASMSLAASCGPKMAARLKKLFADLVDTEKRMR